MKNLAPVFVALITLMAFISALSAQTRIYNPDLPQHLVFQWRIETNTVQSNWKNSDFTIHRDADNMVVYYGTYSSLESALVNRPENVPANTMRLVPFFNQRSITAADALTLLGNRNESDQGQIQNEAVSFTVFFGTFDNLLDESNLATIKGDLSFEVQPNRTLAYSAGNFNTLEDAMAYETELKAAGFEFAEVNKYLNGQKIAGIELNEVYAYLNWNE